MDFSAALICAILKMKKEIQEKGDCMKYTLKERRAFRRNVMQVLGQARVRDMQAFTQHGDTSCLLHCVAVAYYSHRVAVFAGVSCRFASRNCCAARCCTIISCMTGTIRTRRTTCMDSGIPGFALRNAEKDFELTRVERNIIARHMFPLTPKPPTCREAVLVSLVDKACSLYETMGRNCYRRIHFSNLMRLAQENKSLPPTKRYLNYGKAGAINRAGFARGNRRAVPVLIHN